MELAFEFQAMGGLNEIHIQGIDEPAMRLAAQAAITEVRRIEAKYSRYRPDSVVSRINEAAGTGQAVPVDEETAGLLDFAGRLFDISDGMFDITSGVLRKVWNFQKAVVPHHDEVQAMLPLVGWSQVAWRNRQIALPRAGMELDFGGFGKEYAADRAAEIMGLQGVSHGYVNLGGDLRVLGPRADQRPWQLGIRHPRQVNSVITTMVLSAGGLATSGDYERFFEKDGRRYCHLLDPRSGWPVSYWQTVSVVAPSCAGAGAIATVAMLMGANGLPFLEDQGVAYFAVDAEDDAHCSSL